jgi:hypothetical protein
MLLGDGFLGDGFAVERLVDIDEDLVTVDLGGVDGYGHGRGKADRLPGTQVEARAMQPALDFTVTDIALAESDRGVRAFVADGEDLVTAPHERDLDVVDDDRQGALVLDVVECGHSDEVRHRSMPVVASGATGSAPTYPSSSRSTAAKSRGSNSGTPMRLIVSAKKPWTTSRRACSSEMPRLRR